MRLIPGSRIAHRAFLTAGSICTLFNAARIPAQAVTQINFAATPVGDFPSNLTMIDGVMEVVSMNGLNVLRASARSAFLIRLPQVLPNDFTIEVDFIPKVDGAEPDLGLEGTPTINQGTASSYILWHPTTLQVIGGAVDNFETALPSNIAVSTPGVMTRVTVVVQGPTIRVFTNGRLLSTLSNRRFVRGPVLRVFLGGQDDATQAVYLASLQIIPSAMSATQVAGASNPSPTSPASSGASTATTATSPTPQTGTTTGSTSGATTTSATGTSGATTTPTTGTSGATTTTTTGTAITTIAPSATGATTSGTSGTSSTSGATMLPAASPTGTIAPIAGLPPTAGRYRVMLTGFRASEATLENAMSGDGSGDEVYAAAAAVVWDRSMRIVRSLGTVATKEYGELMNPGIYPNRIMGGTMTPRGGIWTGKGVEQIPSQYDPAGQSIPTPATDQFPILVWEGVLNDGIEAVLVMPTLWERDKDQSLYTLWSTKWSTLSLRQHILSPPIMAELGRPQLGVVSLATPGLPISMPIPDMVANVRDHPIGIIPLGATAAVAVEYLDRHVVITREKLSALQTVGASTTVVIAYSTPTTIFSRGSYNLYLRVERLQ